MNDETTLKPATMDDADLLFAWRNDPATRQASHTTAPVQRSEPREWLSRSLGNPARRLYIAEEGGIPVGTVRADFADGVWELSWTVAPNARGRGVAKRMVAALARAIADPIRAEVKATNAASARIAEHAGMHLDRESEGIQHFRRGAVP